MVNVFVANQIRSTGPNEPGVGFRHRRCHLRGIDVPLRQRTVRGRRGAAVLELILTLPVLIIVLLAIVEFGVLTANQQQIEAASHIGAQVASETAAASGEFSSDAAFATGNIVTAIKSELALANIDTADANIKITMQHDVTAGGTRVAGTLVCPPDPTLPAVPATGQYVRVTVCVNIVNGKVAPNLLKTLGFDLTGRAIRQTTTFRHEGT